MTASVDSHRFERWAFHLAAGAADLPQAKCISSALVDKISLMLQGSTGVAQETAAAEDS